MLFRTLAACLILPVLVACSSSASAPATSGAGAKSCVVTGEFEEMAAEFRALRTVKGHFQGAEWNADVDAWAGRKHQLMIALAAWLGAGDCSEEQVRALLGDPDRIAREGDATFGQVRNTPDFQVPATGSYELLIYEWRGDHDFLYLVSQNKMVVASGWWYAGD